MRKYPKIIVSVEMIKSAKALIDVVKVNRTVASKIDTITGILGEFVFAEYYFGDWEKNRVGDNKGDVDFDRIEIKTSAYPFNENLNLLVREDYANKRKPEFYIQIIIDVESPKSSSISPNTTAYICGFATAEQVDASPKRDFGSKFGGDGGYKCHYIRITELWSMADFKEVYERS
jgi:hypothetical protein